MGCNCGKNGTNFNYRFTAPDGTTKTYATEVEAAAAKIRAGGGTIAPVAR